MLHTHRDDCGFSPLFALVSDHKDAGQVLEIMKFLIDPVSEQGIGVDLYTR